MVVCDMVPMDVTHLLLGRPWQFDKKVIHDGVTNCFTFIHMRQRFVLKPLFPSEVQEDKKKMNVKRESERKIESTQVLLNLRSNSLQEREDDAYAKMHNQENKGKLKKSQGKKSQVDHSQRPRGEPRRDKVFPLKGHDQRTKEDFKDIATPALEGHMIRGRLKRTQEKVYQKVDLKPVRTLSAQNHIRKSRHVSPLDDKTCLDANR
ncbi:hypothetical protein CR513_03353, partial [Mucuna pruriens]